MKAKRKGETQHNTEEKKKILHCTGHLVSATRDLLQERKILSVKEKSAFTRDQARGVRASPAIGIQRGGPAWKGGKEHLSRGLVQKWGMYVKFRASTRLNGGKAEDPRSYANRSVKKRVGLAREGGKS